MCGVQDKCVGTPSKKLRNFFVFHLEIKRRLVKHQLPGFQQCMRFWARSAEVTDEAES